MNEQKSGTWLDPTSHHVGWQKLSTGSSKSLDEVSPPTNNPRVYKHGPKGPVNLHIIHPSRTATNQGLP